MKIASTCVLMLCVLFISTNSYGQGSCRLSLAESALAVTTNIDEVAMLVLRQETDSVFKQLTIETYELNAENNSYVRKYIPKHGITFGSDAESSYNIVLKLRDKLNQLGHQIFISHKNEVMNVYTISVIRARDQFDILRTIQTDGENYNITNEMIIQKMSGWNEKYPFFIIGTGSDYVEAVFITSPENLDIFANEIYEFCPDVVDSASGSVKYLADEMELTGILYLWWR